MTFGISHSREEESLEAKARWSQSLTLTERMDLLCAFTDLALELNPRIMEAKPAPQAKGRIQVLTPP